MRCGKKRLEDSVLHDPVRYIHLRLSRRLCPPLPFLRICYRTIIQVIFKELGYYIGLKKKKKDQEGGAMDALDWQINHGVQQA